MISAPRPCTGRGDSAQVERIALQNVKRNDGEGRLMRRRQPDPRRLAGGERLLPALGAQAPAIAGLQTGEAELGHRRRQVVAARTREGEAFGVDLGAYRMPAPILGTGVAAAVAIKPGQGLCAAQGERLAQNIARVAHRAPADFAVTILPSSPAPVAAGRKAKAALSMGGGGRPGRRRGGGGGGGGRGRRGGGGGGGRGGGGGGATLHGVVRWFISAFI